MEKFVGKALLQIESRHTRRVRFEFKATESDLVNHCESRLQEEVERLTGGVKFAVSDGQVTGKKGVIFIRRMDLSESAAELLAKKSREPPPLPAVPLVPSSKSL